MAPGAPQAGPPPAPPDESEWPDENDEAAFLSDAAGRGEGPMPAAERAAVPVIGDSLPALDELVARVPADIRGILDDLFRAKFTGVRRFAASQPPEGGPR
jgi:hypothetical protein